MNTNFWRPRAWSAGAALFLGATAALGAATTTTVTTVANASRVPPAPILEKPLAPITTDFPDEQPSSQHAWVPGHWRWHEGAYVWEAGRWEIPPTPNLVWRSPEWQQQGTGYGLREGYWDQAPAFPESRSQTSSRQEISVTAPPPPPQRELIYERPTASHVWIPGYWSWRGGQHVWTPGSWTTAPRPNAVWVPARWEQRNGRYVLVEGYWRDAVVVTNSPPPRQVVVSSPPPTQQLIVVTAPPEPRREMVYARPTSRHVWVPGYWAWSHNQYVWVAGHYALPPGGRAVWVEPRWDRRGKNWVFVEGHWR